MESVKWFRDKLRAEVEITIPDVAKKVNEASATGDAPPMVVKDPQFPGGTRIVRVLAFKDPQKHINLFETPPPPV
eukprot:1018933-Amphidinium_carterae.1